MKNLTDIIEEILPWFERLYPKSIIEIKYRINRGDCFVMAALTKVIADANGIESELAIGPVHVYVTSGKLAYDSVYSKGVDLDTLPYADSLIDLEYMNSRDFYFADPGIISDLIGYFHNRPERLYFVYKVLDVLGYEIPDFFNRFSTPFKKQEFYEALDRGRKRKFNRMVKWFDKNSEYFLKQQIDLV